LARLALSLFDQTGRCTSSVTTTREMLEYAALLHDIGQQRIAQRPPSSRAYLVEYRAVCAASRPTRSSSSPRSSVTTGAVSRRLSEPRFAALDKDRRDRVRKLAAVLRLADGLDRGRRGTVEQVDVQIGTDLVVLRLHAREDAELELWGVRRRRELFEKIFQRELEATIVRRASPMPRSATSDARDSCSDWLRIR